MEAQIQQLQHENLRLQRECDALSIAKQSYKQKLYVIPLAINEGRTRTLQELGRVKQMEHAGAQERLQREQRELQVCIGAEPIRMC
jgi:hypothetical protein